MRFQILQKLALNKIETVTIHRVFATDLMTSRCNSRSVPNFLSPTLPCVLALLLVNRIQEHLHGKRYTHVDKSLTITTAAWAWTF
ncbi:MAG: hypothetical protein ACPIOQ_22715, partial [Promethearchaeia archaeon]